MPIHILGYNKGTG